MQPPTFHVQKLFPRNTRSRTEPHLEGNTQHFGLLYITLTTNRNSANFSCQCECSETCTNTLCSNILNDTGLVQHTVNLQPTELDNDWLRDGWTVLDSRQEQRIFCSSKRQNRLWGPSASSWIVIRDSFLGGQNSAKFHLVPTLKIRVLFFQMWVRGGAVA